MTRSTLVRTAVLATAVAAVALLVLGGLGVASPGDLELLSQTSPGGVAGNGSSTQPNLSKDGRYAAFLSSAANLGAGGQRQAFLRDVTAATTALVSVGTDGTTPANAAVDSVTVSDDGRRVAFHTRATNIVAGASTAVDRAYVRDLGTGTTSLVAAAAGDDAVDPAISGDGTMVAFASHAHYDGLSSVSLQTYVRDVDTTAIHAVSVGMVVADQPAISESGRFVAVRGQSAGAPGVQVWVRDRTAGTTTLASRRSGDAGDPGSSASDEPALSADGRHVVFRSSAENLSDDDDPAHSGTDIYERDTLQDTTTLVSRANGAAGAAVAYPDNSGSGSVSDDGRLVLFASTADGLAPVAGNGQNVYLRDLDAGTTALVSAKADGSAPPSGAIDGTSMAGDGEFAAFASSASLKTGVTGGQVFRRALGTPPAPPSPPVVSIRDAAAVKEGGPGQVTQAVFTVVLDKAAPKPATVAWSTADGTATGGADFRAAAGQVVFDPGQTSAAVAVDVLGDSASEPSETFRLAIHDAVNAVVSRAAGTGTITDDDPEAPPAADGGTPPPGGQPGGGQGGTALPATTGAPVADCPTKIARGRARLTGCFSGDTAHGKVALNGLLITPLSAGTTITATEKRVSSSAPVMVTAGDLAVSRGDLDLDPTTHVIGPAGMLTPAAGSSVYGLSLEPQVALNLNTSGGAVLKGRISPHFGTVLGTPLDVSITTDEASGLHRDQLVAGASTSLVRAVVTTDLRFTFVPADARWVGSITLNSPVLMALKIAAHIPSSTGAMIGSTRLTNVALHNIVKIRTLDVQLLMDPLRIEGTIDAVAGPLDVFAVDGTVRDDLSTGKVTVSGNARLFGIPLKVPKVNLLGGLGGVGGGFLGGGFNNGFNSAPQQLFDTQGSFTAKLPANAPSPPLELPDLPLRVGGGQFGPAGSFFLSGGGAGHAKVLGADVSAQFFFSEKGFGGCGQIGPLNAGFAVTWNPFKLDLMGPFVCDIGPWKTSASAAQATGGRSVRLGRGKQLVRFTGDTAPPQLVLNGPGGRAVTTPAADQPPIVTSAVTVLRDPATKTTYVGLADGGDGAWTITTQAGSARLTAVDTATVLPAPKVAATVVRRGTGRALRWTATGPSGQHVRFEERGTGIVRRLGEASGHGGTIRFTPAVGAGPRTITATVLQDGKPRTQLTVAHFVASEVSGGGRVRTLKVTLSGRKVTLRWSRVAGAARYLVEVRTASGRVAHTAGGQAHTLTITDLAVPKTATATVTALDAVGHHGPPRTATGRAPGRRT
jgi:Tol biopolymer transport system component